MIKLLKNYTNESEERMNFGLMDKDYDEPLVKYIGNSCKSLEVLSYIKYEGMDIIEDEANIDINKYIRKRKKTKKTEKIKYRYLQDSRYSEVNLKFKITFKDKVKIINKPILLPIPDETGQYLIKGTKYSLLYQIVDSSTYNINNGLTLKSLMPVVIPRNSSDFIDTDGKSYTIPTYVIKVYKKNVDIFLYYFAKVGVVKTLAYFNVNRIIDFTTDELDKENNIYFKINAKLFLEVNKEFFIKHQYVQSMVGMVLNVVTNRLTIENLYSTEFWIKKLGANNNNTKVYNFYERGLNSLTYFDRQIDETTRGILRIHPEHTKNIYSVVRWMIQNYNELRKKDNLDLANKRLRCNEYIASLLTKTFSDRVNRIISYGNKITIEKISEIFKFDGDILIRQLHKSGLLRYDDNVNDMDMFNKLKITQKGPNSLGGKNEKNISVAHRGIHPSFIGKIDINVCGNSDPGTSGVLTPFCKTYGLYFEDGTEPESFKFNFQKEIMEHARKQGNMVFDLYKTREDYYKAEKTFKEIDKKFEYKEKSELMVIKINLKDDDDI